MIDSASRAVEVDGHAAPALTESYTRLRGMVRDLVAASDPSLAEFDAAFPEIQVVAIPTAQSPHSVVTQAMRNHPHATKAQALLGQLAGWVSGVINELTFEQRLRMEAEARVRQGSS